MDTIKTYTCKSLSNGSNCPYMNNNNITSIRTKTNCKAANGAYEGLNLNPAPSKPSREGDQ